jgi:tetratricopeptide (TPR) repeat protein
MNLVLDILKSVLRHQLKEQLGDDALNQIGKSIANTGGQEVLGAWLSDLALRHELDDAARIAGEDFRRQCVDKDLAEWMLSLPLSGLPKIQNALENLPHQGDERALEDSIHDAIETDWKNLTQEQVSYAVKLYLHCIRQALVPLQSQALSVMGRSILRTEAKVDSLHDDVESLIARLDFHRALRSAIPTRTFYMVSSREPLSLEHGSSKLPQLPTRQLAANAWPNTPDLSSTYHRYVETISSLVHLQEYEHANELYWKTLYFSGYRELWKDRLFLSNLITTLSLGVQDPVNAGLIMSKGIAYVYMSQKFYNQAFFMLKRAYRLFHESHYAPGKATCWNYVGDIYADVGKLSKAFGAYEEAIKFSQESDKHQIRLKMQFLETTNKELASSQRISNLLGIRDSFAYIRDYREGLVDMEIAKSLYVLSSVEEALIYSERSVHMLRDLIKMPRNAIRAERVLSVIRAGGSKKGLTLI